MLNNTTSGRINDPEPLTSVMLSDIILKGLYAFYLRGAGNVTTRDKNS